MRKMAYSLVVFLGVILFSVTSASASELLAPKAFVNFVQKAYNDVDGLEAINSIGQDVSKQFIDETYEFYTKGDFDSIYKAYKSKNISLAHTQEQDLATLAASGNTGYKSVVKSFYQQGTSQYGVSKDWGVELRGTYSYQLLPKKVLTVSTPSVTFDTIFGLNYAPYQSNVSTRGRVNGDLAEFSVTYKMGATQSAVHGVPLKDHNFGTFTHTGWDKP